MKTPKSHSEINWPFHARFAKKILTPRNSFFTNSTLCTELSLFFLLFPLFFRQDNFSRLIYPMIRANLSRWMVTPASWITRFVPKIRKLLLKLPAMEKNVLLKIIPKTSINIIEHLSGKQKTPHTTYPYYQKCLKDEIHISCSSIWVKYYKKIISCIVRIFTNLWTNQIVLTKKYRNKWTRNTYVLSRILTNL